MGMAWSHKKSQPGTLNDHGLECFLFPKNSRKMSRKFGVSFPNLFNLASTTILDPKNVLALTQRCAFCCLGLGPKRIKKASESSEKFLGKLFLLPNILKIPARVGFYMANPYFLECHFWEFGSQTC